MLFKCYKCQIEQDTEEIKFGDICGCGAQLMMQVTRIKIVEMHKRVTERYLEEATDDQLIEELNKRGVNVWTAVHAVD